MKKTLRTLFVLFSAAAAVALGYVFVFFPPVMAGMGAKIMCSCVFLTGRTPESVLSKELQVFPGLASTQFNFDHQDSTVTAKILWKTSKAIHRKGFGCTLLAEQSEADVRSQKMVRPFPDVDPDSISWPSGDVTSQQAIPHLDYALLEQTVDRAFIEKDPERPANTHAVVVLYDGKLVIEKYADGFDHRSPMMGWSMTKSIINALVGILINEGRLELHKPAPVPEWKGKDDERAGITLNDLLQASSGLTWEESYFVPTSDFHKMFTKSDDKGEYAASRKSEYEPGTHFEYSSGTTNILSRMIRHVTGDSSYHGFPYEKLFHRIGMLNTTLEPDASGTFVGSSYGFASARDWARFGLLYLNDGVWEGERILPEGWVSYSITPAPAAPLQEYGAHIWLNAGKKGDAKTVKYPGLPNDAFVFDGFEENSVTVIPSRSAVVVRLGVTHHGNFDHAGLVQGVLSALPPAGDNMAAELTSQNTYESR
jgi:CubicO group peptidase (beta-lactamase class C family)